MADFKARAAVRRRCYLTTRFVFNGGYASLDAVARNISPLGARIEAEDMSIVPLEFELLIGSFSGDDRSRRARQIWRHDGAMGVAFVEGSRPTAVKG